MAALKRSHLFIIAVVTMLALAACGFRTSPMERELAGKGYGIWQPENQRLFYRWFGEGWSFRQKFTFFDFGGPIRSSIDGRIVVGAYSGDLIESPPTPPGLPSSGVRRPLVSLSEPSSTLYHGQPSGIVVLDLSGREIWRIEIFRPGYRWLGKTTPALSPDHEKIAEDGPDAAYYFLMRSYEVIQIPGSQRQESEPGVLEFRSIDWAPDSRRIVFETKGKLYVYDIETRQMISLVDGSNPAWSPDGKWIAYRTLEDIGMMVSPETGERRALFKGQKIVGPIRWSPDSEYLMYNIRYSGLANKIESLWNLGDSSFRIKIHRLRDGKEIDARETVPIGILGYHCWVKR
jgi:WD40 repeat protein